jgi:hypothetical protein
LLNDPRSFTWIPSLKMDSPLCRGAGFRVSASARPCKPPTTTSWDQPDDMNLFFLGGGLIYSPTNLLALQSWGRRALPAVGFLGVLYPGPIDRPATST